LPERRRTFLRRMMFSFEHETSAWGIRGSSSTVGSTRARRTYRTEVPGRERSGTQLHNDVGAVRGRLRPHRRAGRPAPLDSLTVTTTEPNRWTDRHSDAVSARKEAYEQLRRASTWRLLAATKAPAALGILQGRCPAGDGRRLRTGLIARVGGHRARLHENQDDGRSEDADGEARGGRSAGEYGDAWVREGYLTRRDDPQRTETTFEPSPAT